MPHSVDAFCYRVCGTETGLDTEMAPNGSGPARARRMHSKERPSSRKKFANPHTRVRVGHKSSLHLSRLRSSKLTGSDGMKCWGFDENDASQQSNALACREPWLFLGSIRSGPPFWEIAVFVFVRKLLSCRITAAWGCNSEIAWQIKHRPSESAQCRILQDNDILWIGTTLLERKQQQAHQLLTRALPLLLLLYVNNISYVLTPWQHFNVHC